MKPAQWDTGDGPEYIATAALPIHRRHGSGWWIETRMTLVSNTMSGFPPASGNRDEAEWILPQESSIAPTVLLSVCPEG